MQPNQFVKNTAPTPCLVGLKRYVLLAAVVGLLGLSYFAFVVPIISASDFDKPTVVFACLAIFFFFGLLVWASNEEDKDKVWGELLSKRLSDPNRSTRDDIQLADLLPEDSHELQKALNVHLASKIDSTDTPGWQMNRRLLKIVSIMASFGLQAIALQAVQLFMSWAIQGADAAKTQVALFFWITGAVLVIPYGAIKLLTRPSPLLRSTGYRRIDSESAKHRRYEFYKFHRQVLLDNGFEELFDARFNSTSCTFFASSNRDTIAEIGIFDYGRMYYGVRTVVEDGTMFTTRSAGFTDIKLSTPDTIHLCICKKMPLENLLRKHAVLLAIRLKDSKSRLVTLKDQVIDHIFLANRYRYTS